MENNLSKIQRIMSKYKVKCMLLVNQDKSDKLFVKYISDKIHTLSFTFIFKNNIYLLVNDLDKDNIININNVNIYTYSTKNDILNFIEEIISKERFVDNISLSYSTMSDTETDILGHGEFLEISNMLKKVYKKFKKNLNIISSENIIYDILQQKSELTVNRLKDLCYITEEIFETLFSTIKVGMTEIEISNIMIEITNRITKKYIDNDRLAFRLAWENCPIVLTGENLLKGGHAIPSDKELKFGDTIYIDFGISCKYSDNEVLYTDLQRMGYALKLNENAVPKRVLKVFNILTASIENCLDFMKPNVYGYVIDEIVRNYILNNKYPNYNHSTGHPVGNRVHDIGTIIGGKLNKRANLRLIENGIYTIEPRIAIVNGGSIEEMILVTKFGGIPISKIQKKLYLVR
jgi:Xaa-Pro aminopeptidase